MFQTLIPQIKEYKKPSLLASLFMTLEVMFEISIPFVMANLLGRASCRIVSNFEQVQIGSG